MKKTGRYKIDGLAEDQYEEGSEGLGLNNFLRIKDKLKMDEVEIRELYRATDELTENYARDHQFTVADICNMHRNWLGKVYEWAGQYRQVTISKGGFTFALPQFIPQLMADFEKTVLSRYTPCNFEDREEQVQALAIVHTELLLIHPFREGNGRLSRLLAMLMALQAGLPPLDFSEFEGKKKRSILRQYETGWKETTSP